MRWMLLWAVWSVGCAPEPTWLDDRAPAWPADLPAGALPPPDFTLSAPNLVAGEPSTLHISGAPPFAAVRMVHSPVGLGAGPCYTALGGLCVPLADPIRRHNPTWYADATGAVDITVTPPAGRGGDYVGLLAVVLGRPGLLSNPVGRRVAPPGSPLEALADADGDGVSIADGDCADHDPAIFPGGGDMAGDHIDADCDDLDEDEAPPTNTPPVATSCELSPRSPRTTHTLQVTSTGSDDDGDPITWSFLWTVDGVPDPTVTTDTWPADRTARGQLIGVTCTPHDDLGPGEPASDAVTILNSAPVVTDCVITPASPHTDDPLLAAATSVDDDGDVVDIQWAWTRNGVGMPAYTTASVPAAATARGETWAVSCTPSDGLTTGTSESDAAFIRNRPPQVTAATPGAAPNENTSLTCQAASSSDPDGDSVTLSYRWYVNGVSSVSTQTITGSSYNGGDVLSCVITASDGTDTATATFGPVTVANLPPPPPTGALITPADAIELDQLTCGLTAGGPDPDGGTVSYTVAWTRNGAPYTGPVSGTYGETIPQGSLVSGNWRCEARGTDGQAVSTTFAFDERWVTDVPVEQFETARLGGLHACAILSSTADTIKCWGNNNHMELGRAAWATTVLIGDAGGEMGDALPETDISAGKPKVADAARFLHLAPGNFHTCVLERLTDSPVGYARLQVRCWGSNSGGQIGIGGGGSSMYADTGALPMGTGVRPVFVQSGRDHVCVLLSNRTTKCWGVGANGRLGYGNTNYIGDTTGELGDVLPAINLGTGRYAVDIAPSWRHTCALLDDGSVKCWGYNASGQLGQGNTIDRGDGANEMGDLLATTDLGGATVVDLEAGWDNTCARFIDGRVKCWGYNATGQLGQGDNNHRGDQAGEMGSSLPYISLGSGRTAVDIDIGFAHTCAILDNDKVKCWGQGTDGKLGYGDTVTRGNAANQMGDNLPYLTFPAGTAAPGRVDLYDGASCLMTECGAFHCWGDSADARTAAGSTTDVLSPTAAIALGTGRTAYVDVVCP